MNLICPTFTGCRVPAWPPPAPPRAHDIAWHGDGQSTWYATTCPPVVGARADPEDLTSTTGEQCALLLDAKRGSHGRDFCDRVSCAGKKGSLAQQEDSDQKLLRVAESKIDRPAVTPKVSSIVSGHAKLQPASAVRASIFIALVS